MDSDLKPLPKPKAMEMTGRGKVENQKPVSHSPHRPWKSPSDFHIPTASTAILFLPNSEHRDYRDRIIERSPTGLRLAQRPSGSSFDWNMLIELGLCLDLTTSAGMEWIKSAHSSLKAMARGMPANSEDGLRRNLDCAVIRRLHTIFEALNLPPVDTVKGIFTEGPAAYPGSGFQEKTHVQIAVRNLRCIKGVFRVPQDELRL